MPAVRVHGQLRTHFRRAEDGGWLAWVEGNGAWHEGPPVVVRGATKAEAHRAAVADALEQIAAFWLRPGADGREPGGIVAHTAARNASRQAAVVRSGKGSTKGLDLAMTSYMGPWPAM